MEHKQQSADALAPDNLVIVKVYEKEPKGFTAQVHVAACYVEIGEKLLLLRLAANRSEAGRWGVPAGKLEKGETARQAAVRELYEETGISVAKNQAQALGSLYIQKPHINYVYHLFQIHLKTAPEVRLSAEHDTYLWASKEDLERQPLMAGAEDALSYYTQTRRNLISTTDP